MSLRNTSQPDGFPPDELTTSTLLGDRIEFYKHLTFEKSPRLPEKRVCKQALTLGGGGWEMVLAKNVDLVFFRSPAKPGPS